MIIDTLFGTPIDDLVYRPTKTISKTLIEDLQREYSFKIDLGEYDMNAPIDTKAIFIKGDKNTSILKASIYKRGTVVNLTGYTVTANIREGFNEVATTVCTIIDATAGLIEINLPESFVDEQGENTFEITLQKSNKVIVSQQYKYTVLDSLGEGNPGEETQMTALQQLIQQVLNQHTELNNITTELEVTVTEFDPAVVLVDFTYTDNGNGTYTITGWKGTYNGEASSEMIVPNNAYVIV